MARPYLRPYAHIIWTDATTGLATALHLWCVSRNHGGDVDITEHAVEDGADVTDNARPNPAAPTIEAFISNEPVEAPFFSTLAETQGALDAFTQTATTVPGNASLAPLAQLPQAGFPAQPMAMVVKDWFRPGDAIGLLVGNLIAFEIDSVQFATSKISQQYLPTVTATTLQFDQEFDAVTQTLGVLENLRQTSTLLTVVTQEGSYAPCLIRSYKIEKTHDTGTGANLTIEFAAIRIVQTQRVNAPVPLEPRGNGTLSQGNQDTGPSTTGATKESLALSLGLNNLFGI
jgi:hypothetical protein